MKQQYFCKQIIYLQLSCSNTYLQRNIEYLKNIQYLQNIVLLKIQQGKFNKIIAINQSISWFKYFIVYILQQIIVVKQMSYYCNGYSTYCGSTLACCCYYNYSSVASCCSCSTSLLWYWWLVISLGITFFVVIIIVCICRCRRRRNLLMVQTPDLSLTVRDPMMQQGNMGQPYMQQQPYSQQPYQNNNNMQPYQQNNNMQPYQNSNNMQPMQAKY